MSVKLGNIIQVKHNNTDISDYVVSYIREHNICTGIATAQIAFDSNIGRVFNPYDKITISEGGVSKGLFYVSTDAVINPDGTVAVECQDSSKKLVDYFISDNYIVDYPSNSKTWIIKFLNDAKVPYRFLDNSPGGMLSNNTSLGMVSAYDQILSLLQLSGWYMTFDGSGKAIIGKLFSNLSPVKATLTKDKILSIKLVQNDKMLRNRVVVWGSTNPITSSWVFSDVSMPSKWDYDNKFRRTAVISNSNIPTVSDATVIATKALNEFSKLYPEKHLEVAGPVDVSIGQVVMVKSNIYRGIGRVTFVGSSLSERGLVTNIVLDQRCPRLFGYYDFGDYVYTSTFGKGVWRKHLQYDHTWYNYSNGLEKDLRITDLYKNNGLLSCVSASGGAFYRYDEQDTWTPIVMESGLSYLPSGAAEDIVYSGEDLKARCVIQDKWTNELRIGYDTYSGENSWNYNILSGVAASSVLNVNSFIVNYLPETASGYSHIPISVSGNYNFLVLDIENDGANDFVSVAQPTSIITVLSGGPVMGFQEGLVYNEFSHVSYTNQPIGSVLSGIITHTRAIPTGETYSAPYGSYDNPGNRQVVRIKMKQTDYFEGDPPVLMSNIKFYLVRHILDYESEVITEQEVKLPVEFNDSKLEIGFYSSSPHWFWGLHQVGRDHFRIAIKDKNKYIHIYNVYFNSMTSSEVFLEEPYSIPHQIKRCDNDSTYWIYSNPRQCASIGSVPGIGNNREGKTFGLIYDMWRDRDIGNYATQIKVMIVDLANLEVRREDVQPKIGSLESPECLQFLGANHNDFINSLERRPEDILPHEFEYGIPAPGVSIEAFEYNGVMMKVPYVRKVTFESPHYPYIFLLRAYYCVRNFIGANFRIEDSDHGVYEPYILNPPTTLCTKYNYYRQNVPFGLPQISAIKFGFPNISNITPAVIVRSAHPYKFNVEIPPNHTIIPLRTGKNQLDGEFVIRNTVNGKFMIINIETGDITELEEPGFGYVWQQFLTYGDSVKNYIYAIYYNQMAAAQYRYKIVGWETATGKIMFWFFPYDASHQYFGGINTQSWLCGSQSGRLYTRYFKTIIDPGNKFSYLILRRDESDFTVVHSGDLPWRLDISNYYPLVALESGIGSLSILESYPSGVSTSNLTPIDNTGRFVGDFRYALSASSGIAEVDNFLYYTENFNLLSIPMSGIDFMEMPSGNPIFTVSGALLTKLETSNFMSPTQYMFTTYSSMTGSFGFYQQDPVYSGITLLSGFVERSDNFPQAIPTMIRLDDRI